MDSSEEEDDFSTHEYITPQSCINAIYLSKTENPLGDAIDYKNNEVIKLLENHGAKLQIAPMHVKNILEIPEYEIDPRELDFLNSVQITKGTFHMATWRGVQVAVKRLDEDLKAFRDELALLLKIRHPNVVQFLGAVTQSSPMMIVTEYLPKMIEGCMPFNNQPDSRVPNSYAAKERPPFRAPPRHYSFGLKELIVQCWSENPAVRPTCRDIIERFTDIQNHIIQKQRWKPLGDAIHYKNNEVIKLLEKHGAKLHIASMHVKNIREIPEYEIDPRELDFPNRVQITKGTFHMATCHGVQVAVKRLDEDMLTDEDKVTTFRDELAFLLKIRHPNVVQFLGAVTQSSPMMIVTEYLPKMIEGCMPFNTQPDSRFPNLYASKERPPFRAPPRHCAFGLRELIVQCWSENPAVRPTCRDIIERLADIQNHII